MTSQYSSENLHAQIFQRLLDVIPDLLTIEDSGKSEIKGLTSLEFEVVQRTPEKLIIGLSHSCKKPSGGTIRNPDMTIAVYPNRGMAEALTYKDSHMFNAVYTPNRNQIDILAKRVLNDYLHTWLGSLITQGHSIKAEINHE